jgi:hypothetical protein
MIGSSQCALELGFLLALPHSADIPGMHSNSQLCFDDSNFISFVKSDSVLVPTAAVTPVVLWAHVQSGHVTGQVPFLMFYSPGAFFRLYGENTITWGYLYIFIINKSELQLLCGF